MYIKIIGISLYSLTLISCNNVQVKQAEIKEPIQIDNKAEVKPVAITKVVAKIRRGTEIGAVKTGWFCLGNQQLKWRTGSKVNMSSEEFTDIFREELEVNGWPVVGSTENLFEGYDISGAELLIAAKVSELEMNLCYVNAGFGDFSNAKGSSRIKVDWQIYNPARKEIIGEVTTEGSSEALKMIEDASYTLLEESFALAVNNLLASEEFSDYSQRTVGLIETQVQDQFYIQNTLLRFASIKEALDYAKNSTVVVRVPMAHGSGFAIGDGSYVVTNAHVTGNAEMVTVVTSNKLEVDARVRYTDKGRDIALLELVGIKLPPLYISDKHLDIGDDIYAIGAPLSEDRLSGTVTKGIVSAHRIHEGYEWIQGDVAISGGNSGGPLINKNGSVVGISTAGFTNTGSQIGLNLFIPIKDGIDKLGARLESE